MGKISLIYESLLSRLERQIPTSNQSQIQSQTRNSFNTSRLELLARSRETLSNIKMSKFCSCFHADDEEPPEIIVHSISPQLIQTDNIDLQLLNDKFSEFVDELDLSQINKQKMLELPLEKKWQLFCSRNNDDDQSLVSFSPEYYIDRLANQQPQESTKLYESLRTALRTQRNSFVARFLSLDGLQSLLNVLSDISHIKSHGQVITCVKSLMNNSGGRAHVLAHSHSLNVISQTLASDNIKAKVDVLEILGAVCLVPGGHRKILTAINYLQNFAGERARFQTILNDLDRSTGPYKQDVTLKTAIMSFLNAVLSYGPGEESLEFRLHLRYELLMLGIEPIINKLRLFDNQTLDKHIDFFGQVRLDDEKEFAKNWGTESHVNSKNVDEMFEMVKMRLSHSYAFTNLQSILNHLLLLPLNIGSPPPYHWLLIDRVIQQIVLHQNGEDPDHLICPINVNRLVHNLEIEETTRENLEKLDQLSKENQQVKSNLISKEQELELKIQENEDLTENMTRLRDRLEKESLFRLEESQRVSELQIQIKQIQATQTETPPTAPARSPKSTPPPMTNGDKTPPTANQNQQIITNGQSQASAPPAPPQAPPLAPPQAPPLAPPLAPPAPPFIPNPPQIRKEKRIPDSSLPLKSFNWCKIPDSKLQNTLWAELEESSLYKILDLQEVDRLFSAFNSKIDLTNSDQKPKLNIQKNYSIIDSRRAQNCTILLSKLKMSDDEICSSILSMDQYEELPLDMIEQLLKFTPNNEEKSLLEEHGIECLARADSFLFKISRIIHYEERLRVLHYKKRFPLILEENNLRIKIVTEACRELNRSKKLRKMLELVLALGNYMNRKGGRGNAQGFKLPSLIRIQDTKSNTKNNGNLLHFLVRQCEEKFHEILDLENELKHCKSASKISLMELEKDMAYLKNGLENVNSEVEFHKNLLPQPNDRFLPCVREFLSTAGLKIMEIQEDFLQLKLLFLRTVGMFGEDYTQIDEFFSLFDQFLTAFAEAKADNESLRKRKEEEEKRANDQTLRRKSTVERGSSEQSRHQQNNNSQNNGEFDDLISALRTGDVFSDDVVSKFSSKRSRNNNKNNRATNNIINSRERIH